MENMETMETPTPRCTPGHEYRCREAKSNICHCNCGGAHHGIGMQFDWVRAVEERRDRSARRGGRG